MSYSVFVTPKFKKEFKRLFKKYKSLNSDLNELIDELSQNPTIGTDLGNNIYKVRLVISSKSKGKSGGARVITYAKVNEFQVLLLTIYNKGEKDSITNEEIRALKKEAGLEE